MPDRKQTKPISYKFEEKYINKIPRKISTKLENALILFAILFISFYISILIWAAYNEGRLFLLTLEKDILQGSPEIF